MNFVEKVNYESYCCSLYKCYEKLVELGFDFEDNSAKDFIECIVYLYENNMYIDEDVPF